MKVRSRVQIPIVPITSICNIQSNYNYNPQVLQLGQSLIIFYLALKFALNLISPDNQVDQT
jgi:hypothetical protein